MIELPEALAIAQQLQELVVGRTIVGVKVGENPNQVAFYTGDLADYPAKLEGGRILSARPIGGQIELAIGGIRLLLAGGVSLRFLPPERPRPITHQMLIELEDGSALVAEVYFHGSLMLLAPETSGYLGHTIALNKPSPLVEEFDPGYFARLVDSVHGEASLKGLLATEQRIPGLGNGCLQDVLFMAGMNPATSVSALSRGERERLYGALTATLRIMAADGGRDTEQDLFGVRGRYRTVLSARTAHLPCPRCESRIVRQNYLGGYVYFCPQCQPVRQ